MANENVPNENNSGRTQGSNKAFAKSLGFSAARGAVLIVIAIVVGIVLLQVVDNGSTGAVGRSDTETTATSKKTEKPSTTVTTEPEKKARSPQEVKVLVLNGSKVNGAAGKVADQIGNKSYDMLSPADGGSQSGSTIVYFKEGYDAEASELASLVGSAIKDAGLSGLSSNATAEPVPAPLPSNWKGDTEGANLIVVLGAA